MYAIRKKTINNYTRINKCQIWISLWQWQTLEIYCIYFNPTQELQLSVLTMKIEVEVKMTMMMSIYLMWSWLVVLSDKVVVTQPISCSSVLTISFINQDEDARVRVLAYIGFSETENVLISFFIDMFLLPNHENYKLLLFSK